MEKKDKFNTKYFIHQKTFLICHHFYFPHNFVYLDCFSESENTQEGRRALMRDGQSGQEEKFFCLERGVNGYVRRYIYI